ncbi:hypothetical protein ACFQ2B_35705 [Streptomyces stramineus]
MTNRRGVNWPMEDRPWTPGKARERVLAQLREWGYTADEAMVGDLVTTLVGQAVQDTRARISVHMSPKGDQILVVVLSHQSGRPAADEATVRGLAGHRAVVSCGVETSTEGPSLWAVMDLNRPRPSATATRRETLGSALRRAL